jgi:flagellar biosynthetic protein FlhB
MADTRSKTEKPTPRRLLKARREGQFASSKDFVGGLQFALLIGMVAAYGSTWLSILKQTTRLALHQAFNTGLDGAQVSELLASTLKQALLPLALAGGIPVVAGIAFQFASTKMGASFKKLVPTLKNFKPLSKIKSIPSQGIPSALQAILMLLLSGAVLYWLVVRNADALFLLPLSSLEVGLSKMRSSCFEVLWKGAALLLAFGMVDLFRQKRRFMKQMRMSKQEVGDELKETEGNPQIKARVRRLQRDFRRRKMMSEVSTATAVIVNPTHYAVAIRYRHDTMSTPLVVAKGKNYLALRIRQRAMDHNVPLIENPPLAQALYKSAQVGQEIPPNFYRAIAELLAYVYKMMGTAVE